MIPALAAAVALAGAAGCGGSSMNAPRGQGVAAAHPDAAAATPAAGSQGPPATPFRLPCGDKDLVGCTNGCSEKITEDCVTLASMYMTGEVVSADHDRAIGLLKAACEENSARGCMRLGDAYHAGILTGEAEEVASYRKACEAGANLGCVTAGQAYLAGKGGEADPKLAALLFTKVCDRGNAKGCFELALLLERGEGVKKDVPRSFELFSKACNLGLDEGCLAASRTDPPRN